MTGRHTYSDVVRSWGKKRQILTRLAKNISVIPGEREERYYTGWSLKTVNCNLFLTNPKNSKSAKTRWFSESLYREVLVFWCFKTVRCVEICLSELFQYRAFATPYRAWPLLYNLIRFFLFPTIHCITFWYTCIRVEKKAKKGKGFPWLLWRIVILSCCDI